MNFQRYGNFLRTMIFLQVFTLIINAYYLPEIQLGQIVTFTDDFYSRFFTVPIDHFAYTDARTFKLRYFINVTHFVPNGPIFFYTGGEATIMRYLDRMGFVWDIAKEFGAAIVFAEHHMGYLTAEQGLADYAMLITHLKQVVVHSFINAEGYESSSLNRLTGRALERSGCNLEKIHASYEAIYKLSRTDKGRAFLNKALRLNQTESVLQTSKDGDELLLMLQYGMQDMTMFNFPIQSNSLPGHLKNFAKPIASILQCVWGGSIILCHQRLQRSICEGQIDPYSWTFLYCTEMVANVCSKGPPFDPFLKDCPYSIEKELMTVKRS
uniref:Uncharacterized protein n=1 Tax=Ditylenchus dipsaci TaxID=166011 RepID=A0A915CP84_9BILA